MGVASFIIYFPLKIPKRSKPKTFPALETRSGYAFSELITTIIILNECLGKFIGEAFEGFFVEELLEKPPKKNPKNLLKNH